MAVEGGCPTSYKREADVVGAAVECTAGDQVLRDHFIVCGLGHVGYRIALLLPRLGLGAAVIYDHAPEEWLDEVRGAGVVCIQGDARDERLLRQAGIERARGLIAATDRDLVNLSVILDGMRLNPGATASLRLYDQELARHLEGSVARLQVLSTSALAAPVFVAAALGQDALGCFELGGHPYVAVDAESGCTETELEGSLCLFRAKEDEREAGIDSGAGAKSGDCLIVRPAQGCTGPSKRMSLGPWVQSAGGMVAALRNVPQGVRILLGVLAAVVTAGTMTVHFSMGLDYLDSLYFVVTTVTTTGYGDLSFRSAPPLVKLFGCVLMLSGAALLALLFGIITDAVISRRFRGLLAGRPVRLRGHTIVAGSGHVAFRIVEELLREGQEAVVVSPEGENAAALHGLRVPRIEGDGRIEAVLRLAGVETAAAIIAVHDDDVVNLGTGFLGRKLNPAIRTVVRVFDGQLAEKLQHQLGLDRVLSVSAVSAPAFVAAALYGRVEQAMVWRDNLVVLRTSDCQEPPNSASDLTAILTRDPGTGGLLRASSPPSPPTRGPDVCLVALLHRLRPLSTDLAPVARP